LNTPVKNYLTITKTQWNGLVILVLLIIGVLAIPYVYPYFNKDKPINFSKFNRAVAQLKQAGVTGNMPHDVDAASLSTSATLFAFNPNKLPPSQWHRLGLSDRQIKGINNYESKGGRFYSKADVKKMYTLTQADYKRLEPYISLPAGADGESQKPTVIIELNTADSALLTQLKGIGPGFARRIVQYRTRLGGYHSKQQLKEIFGMDDMRYKDVQGQFRVNPRKVKRMDVNTVEYDDLKNFPYLSYKQTNALIQYRKQHGNYETFNELRNVVLINESTMLKIKPYLVVK
jgi:competence protein ComEA